MRQKMFKISLKIQKICQYKREYYGIIWDKLDGEGSKCGS